MLNDDQDKWEEEMLELFSCQIAHPVKHTVKEEEEDQVRHLQNMPSFLLFRDGEACSN